MEIVKICNYPIAANTYIAYEENEKLGVVIDPSFHTKGAVEAVAAEGIDIVAIYLTHGHFDHIAGVDELRRALNIPVYIHRLDAEMLTSAKLNQGEVYGLDIVTKPAEHIFDEGDELITGGSVWKVMSTPGHTPGSVCLMCGDTMFSGDTLFSMSIGRTDFPGGSWTDMESSLERLAALDVDYKVYPGHGEATSLFREIDSNPFLRR